MTIAFQSCCARMREFPSHNAMTDDAKAQHASHSDTSTFLFRREVGDGTTIVRQQLLKKSAGQLTGAPGPGKSAESCLPDQISCRPLLCLRPRFIQHRKCVKHECLS